MSEIFVYGSLKKNYWNHHLLSGAEFIGDAEIKGTLYELGPFPGYRREGDGSVSGELYRIDDKTLERLDILEGYNKSNPKQSLYVRVEVDDVQVYEIQEIYARHCPIIPGGVWNGGKKEE